MKLLTTVYVIGHRAKVSVSKRTLMVTDPEHGRTRVPIEEVEALVLLGQAQVTSQTLDTCVRAGVGVTSLTRSGRVRFAVRGGTSGNVELRLAQVRSSDSPDESLAIARWIVAGKLQNSQRLVRRWARDVDEPRRSAMTGRADEISRLLGRVEYADNPDLVRGLEGDGARAYFQAIGTALAGTGLPFTARVRRPPRDPVNALLGFSYALLVSETVGALDAVGLDPQIGFLHRQRPGRPSLALDLIEELRAPVADRFVLRVVRLKQLTADHFVSAPAGACYLSDEGRRRFLRLYEQAREEEIFHTILGRPVGRWALPHVQATLMARHLRGDIPAYPPFLLSGV